MPRDDPRPPHQEAYPIQLPVGSGELFTGHIDVIERKQYIFDDDTLGRTFEVVDVPDTIRKRSRRRGTM